MKKLILLFVLFIFVLFTACSPNQEPPKSGDYTYTLAESTENINIWTIPVTHKVKKSDSNPEKIVSGINISAAKNEFEPFQIIISKNYGNINISMDNFQNLGANQKISIYKVEYEGDWSEYLTPKEQNSSINLNSSYGTPIWILVYIPKEATSGQHTTNLTITHNNKVINIPVNLYVFYFAISDEIHYHSQLNVSISSLIPDGGITEDAKNMLFEHRLTPASVTWPSGFNPSITWDNSNSPNQCEIFYDEPDEGNEYSIGWLAPRYILGEGWNGVGFPDVMLFQFVNNSTPRPNTFCGIARGDHYGTTSYNNEWQQFLTSLSTYLTNNNFINKTYYYVMNEPQDEEDYKLAAHLSRLTKQAAPNLRIAVSEEPKPEIAEHSDGACTYDIWIAHIQAYQKDYAWERQRDYNEEVWFYSLDHDPDPYFNPTKVETQGMNQRIIPWASWKYRTTGWAYYDAGRFFRNGIPTIRAELLREGFEDYEYLYIANNNLYPVVFQNHIIDESVNSVASSLTSWNKDDDAFMVFRHKLGLYIEGTIAEPPVIEIASNRPKGEYYINFQDVTGQPTDNPLIVDGKTYIKIGWVAYNEDDYYGWFGEYISNPNIAKYGYDVVSGYNEAQKSYLYDDYGRKNLFEFDLENGEYEVTIGAGRPQKGYPNDPHNVTVEGVVFIDDEITTNANPIIERTKNVVITDGKLSIEMGGKSASTGQYSYTFMEYVKIVPVD